MSPQGLVKMLQQSGQGLIDRLQSAIIGQRDGSLGLRPVIRLSNRMDTFNCRGL